MTTEVAKATLVRAERAAAPRRTTFLPHAWMVVSVACLAAFTALQFYAEWRSNSGWANVSRTGPLSRYSDWPAIRYEFAGDVARYVALSLASLTLVVRGRRGLFWVPAVAY